MLCIGPSPNESASFGSFVRERRELLLDRTSGFTLRKFAEKLGIQPSYISKIERNEVPPPSEDTIVRMAKLLGEDPDVLLAMAGKVSADLRQVIMKRPLLFAELLRQLKDQPDHALLRVVREVREGNW
jgi:HTH-type transcriptional regulator, competence development regulator